MRTRLYAWWPVVALACVLVLIASYDRLVLHFLGWDGQTSDNYAAWSGSVPAMISAVGLSSIAAGAHRMFKCHVDGCPRLGRYHAAGGAYRLCRVHHWNPHVRDGRMTMLHIHAEHHAHMRRAG